jgi:hypothetical protein
MSRMVGYLPAVGRATREIGVLARVGVGLAAGMAVASPFDLRVGAERAIFHFLLAAGLGAAAAWLRHHHGTSRSVAARLALWATATLALTQLVDGASAMVNPRGDEVLQGISNLLGMAVLHPVVMISLVTLVVSFRRRHPARS